MTRVPASRAKEPHTGGYNAAVDYARIAALLAPFGVELSDAQLTQVATYLDLLLRWNARMNLTAVRDAEQIVQRHFGESFFAARLLLAPGRRDQAPSGILTERQANSGFQTPPVGPAGGAPGRRDQAPSGIATERNPIGGLQMPPGGTAGGAPGRRDQALSEILTERQANSGFQTPPGGTAGGAQGRRDQAPSEILTERQANSGFQINDVGAGAGFPGLPIKIFAPECDLTLIESNSRKATFLNEVIRALKLAHARVFPGRAEQVSARADLVTLRAVESFAQVLPIAASLVQPGGRLGLMIGEAQVADAHRIAPSLKWTEPAAVPLSQSRVLLVGEQPSDEESS